MSGTPALAVASALLVACLGSAAANADEPAAAPEPLSLQRLAQAAPPSKDDLFGTAEAKPGAGSKDDLFGTGARPADKPAARFSGFLEGLAGYTYAEPSHWSRGVGRLQVVGQGELAENVKWKIGGRVDADLVYITSDFYLDAVKRNQRLSAIWGENYVDFSAGAWDFRLGAQQIVWGEVVGLFFADVVSARDTREFLLPGFDLIRIPQWAARAEYFAGDSHLELVWIPVPTFDRIGKPGSDFYPAPLPSPTSAAAAAVFADPQAPDRNIRNSNAGVRANTLVSGWDVAAFYYRSYSTAPTFYRMPGSNPAQPVAFQPRYDRIWQAGGTVTKDFGDVVVRAESVYARGQRFSVTDPFAPDGVVERSTFDYIVSAEFQPWEDTRINVQGFQRIYSGGDVGNLALKSDGFGASLFLSTKFGGVFEPQVLWIQSFRHAGSLVRPRLNWSAAKNVTVGFGFDIFSGPADGYFGRYGNRDRAYTEVRLDF